MNDNEIRQEILEREHSWIRSYQELLTERETLSKRVFYLETELEKLKNVVANIRLSV